MREGRKRSVITVIRKVSIRRGSEDRQWLGLVFILPWLLGILFLQAYPLISSLLYSFCDYSILASPKFVGFKNFSNMFTLDSLFQTSLKVTLKYVAITLPSRLIVSLLLAMLMNRPLKGIGFFRAVYYIPSLLGGSVAISIIWRFVFGGNGTINNILNSMGLASVQWLSSPTITIWIIGLLNIWQFGASMLIFLAALKNVPKDYYEAADIEGATGIRKFFSITLPQISSVILFNIVMEMIRSFQDFSAPFIITSGGPMNSTYVYSMKIYKDAFANFKMGYACAESWVLFLIIGLFTLIIFGTSRFWVFYSDQQ